MGNKKFNGEKYAYYKSGGIVYDLPTKWSAYIKGSEKRRHMRFNGWGDLERLYKDEYSK